MFPLSKELYERTLRGFLNPDPDWQITSKMTLWGESINSKSYPETSPTFMIVRAACAINSLCSERQKCQSAVNQQLWCERVLPHVAFVAVRVSDLSGSLMREKSPEAAWAGLKAAASHCWASSLAGGSTCVTAASSCSSSWVSVVVSSSPCCLLADRGRSECPRTRRCTPGSPQRNPAAGSCLQTRCWGEKREGELGDGKKK